VIRSYPSLDDPPHGRHGGNERRPRHPGYGVLQSAYDAAFPLSQTSSSTPAARLRLDNVALVPASLLPFKREWQAVANGMPKGSVRLCSTTDPRQKRILKQVSAHLQRKGHQAQTVPAERMVGPRHSRNPGGSSRQG
jgi:hypothetical protein